MNWTPFKRGETVLCNGEAVRYIQPCTPKGRMHIVSDGKFTVKVSRASLSAMPPKPEFPAGYMQQRGAA